MPSTATDRIDGLTTSVAVKAPCAAISSTNIALAGLQTINGVILAAGDRVLVAGQTSTVNNGIYIVGSSAWLRSPDFDGARDAVPGTLIVVKGTGSDVIYKTVCSDNPVQIGSSSITFSLAAFGDASTVSFLQAGTGAVARSARDKMRDIVSVLDFGVVGDGVSDDTTNIQRALTYAAGRQLVFTGGYTYLFSTLTVSANTIVRMDGATLKQKVLASGTGSPMFLVTGSGCQFFGGTLNGQRASQPANGYSDSFNGGGGGTGRSFRAGIKADSTVNSVQDLVVRGVKFTGLYGACVATRDVPNVAVEDCYATSTNFELAWCGKSAATLVNVSYQRNLIDSVGTGDPTVNADNLYAAQYSRAQVIGNRVANGERCLVKLESCTVSTVVGNVYHTNSTGNLPAIQLDGANTAAQVVIANNSLYNVQAGISLSSGTFRSVSVSGNVVDTTTAPSTGDGISVTSNVASANLVIAGNSLYNIKRNAIIIQGTWAGTVITDNVCTGQGTAVSYGIFIGVNTGDWTVATIIKGNIFTGFEASATGAGVVNFSRTGGLVINNLIVQGNSILAGGVLNRGLRTGGVDMFPSGIIADNYIDGTLELYSAPLKYRNNTVTGTVTVPAGNANVEIEGKIQTTIGAAGGASALPATPTGYSLQVINGTERAVPYYTKS